MNRLNITKEKINQPDIKRLIVLILFVPRKDATNLVQNNTENVNVNIKMSEKWNIKM